MKKSILTCLLGTSLLTSSCNAQLLFDDFNGGTINSSLWTTSLPFGQSQVYQSGGRAVMIGRGGLDSVQSFPANIQMSGSFRFTGSEDHLAIMLRSNGGYFPGGFGEKYGIKVAFLQDGNEVRIGEYKLDNSVTVIAAQSYSFAPDTDYSFQITDVGGTISLYMMGSATPIIQASSAAIAGNKISIYNREYAQSKSEINFVSIVPEPSALAIVGLGFVALCSRRNSLKSKSAN